MNITSESDSQNLSIVSLAGPFTRDNATANRIEKKTIWSTSFFAAASKKLCGTMCSMTLPNVGAFCAYSAALSGVASASEIPEPGLMRFTAISPTASARVVTISKYTIDRNARRPTFFMSSPWPAMPTTSVAKSNGTISDLIIRRNTDDVAFMYMMKSGCSAAGSR